MEDVAEKTDALKRLSVDLIHNLGSFLKLYKNSTSGQKIDFQEFIQKLLDLFGKRRGNDCDLSIYSRK
jgi:hypothetical protein